MIAEALIYVVCTVLVPVDCKKIVSSQLLPDQIAVTCQSKSEMVTHIHDFPAGIPRIYYDRRTDDDAMLQVRCYQVED